jgi:ATP-dependent 26S proteasome regulatory subunit
MNQLATPAGEVATALWPDNTIAQLLQQLERIDLLLQQWADQVRQQNEHHVLETFILSQDEINARILAPEGGPSCLTSITQWNNDASTLEVGNCELLDRLVARFDLTDFEKDVILLGLLPYFDSRYFSLFSALQNSQQKRLPSFELTLNLFCSFPLEKVLQEVSFLPQSPLLNFQLLNLGKKGEQQGEGWNQTLFQTDPGIYHYLTGRCHLPISLADCAEWLSAADSSEQALCPPSVGAGLAALVADAQGVRPVMMLRGAADGGRALAITSAAMALQCETLQLDISRLPENDKDAQLLLTQILREIRMRDAVLLVRSLDTLAEERKNLLVAFAQQLNQPGLRVVCLCEPQAAMIWLPHIRQLVVEMPVFDVAEKEALLRRSLDPVSAERIDVAALSRRLHFTAQTLPRILQEAQGYRALRNPSSMLTEGDLHKAFSLRSQQNFGNLARRIEPRRTFDDLIVGEELHRHLTEILIATKHRNCILEKGFAAKVGYGTGVSALFYGDSGTGKTMAAEVIAGQLGVDVIKIDLATVVSKYIGETEKNLSRIFDLAEADAGVLFFDEADALFGKRSTVKDAKDRHANIEVSYLLQRLESYPGLVILATNNRSHLDDAFSRRFTFIARFAFPDAILRERMWRGIWPEQVSVAPEVDFKLLALRADLTGANIRNIALLATWLAADDGSDNIGYPHIERAMQRELAKIGRLALHTGA